MNLPANLTLLASATPPHTDLLPHWHPSPPMPPLATDYIAARWAVYTAAARAAGHSLFDGPITQLLDVHQEPTPAGTRIDLHLAPAQYKDFLVTRLRDRPWFEAHAPDAMTLALGNSALPTHGNHALLGLRSPRVSAYPGRLHLIGGVLEALGTPQFPAHRAGIEAHLLQELVEEIGLVPGEERRDGWPRFLAVAHDDFLGQPELIWQWELDVPLEDLLPRLDPAEHTSALILQKSAMTPALWPQLTPVAQQAWLMWSLNPLNQ